MRTTAASIRCWPPAAMWCGGGRRRHRLRLRGHRFPPGRPLPSPSSTSARAAGQGEQAGGVALLADQVSAPRPRRPRAPSASSPAPRSASRGATAGDRREVRPRRSQAPADPGTEFVLRADLVFLAIGFASPIHEGLLEQSGADLDGRGNVKANVTDYQTSVPKLYAAGDMRRGQSLVVWAIREAVRRPTPLTSPSWAPPPCRADLRHLLKRNGRAFARPFAFPMVRSGPRRGASSDR